jgi:GNAT superfamily N-acetyltransferase
MSVVAEPDATFTTRQIRVRPMRADDMDAVSEMFFTAGDDALHNRFFTLGDRMVSEHVLELSDPRGPHCLVAVADGHVVGIVEMAEVGQHIEEVALLVAAGMHHHGIGTLLLTEALADAWRRGVKTFVADVLTTNHLMLEVFTDAGATMSREGGDVSVTLPTRKPQAKQRQRSTPRRRPVDTQDQTQTCEVPA